MNLTEWEIDQTLHLGQNPGKYKAQIRDILLLDGQFAPNMSLTPSISTLAETPLTPNILCIISHSTSHHASLHTRLHIVSSTVHQQKAPSHHCSSASAMPHKYSTYTLHHFTSHHITSHHVCSHHIFSPCQWRRVSPGGWECLGLRTFKFCLALRRFVFF